MTHKSNHLAEYLRIDNKSCFYSSYFCQISTMPFIVKFCLIYSFIFERNCGNLWERIKRENCFGQDLNLYSESSSLIQIHIIWRLKNINTNKQKHKKKSGNTVSQKLRDANTLTTIYVSYFLSFFIIFQNSWDSLVFSCSQRVK